MRAGLPKAMVTATATCALLGGIVLACGGGVQMPVPVPQPKRPEPALTEPAVLCEDPGLEPDDFCLPAARVEPLLLDGEWEVLYHRHTESGVSRPSVVHLRFPDEGDGGIVIRAKWKVAPLGGHGFNNSPPRELAAYEAQKLFLDPPDYVVPPTVPVCVPAERHARTISDAKPTFEGTRCVLVVLSYWLENVTPEGARDMQRFQVDASYRDSLARLNLLTYLIGHRDPRDANFLISKDPDRPRVFAIDNGLAFGGFRNPFTFFYGDWGSIRVPALRRDDVERLRGVTRVHLDRLAVVAQYRIDDGMLVADAPGEPLDPDRAVRVSDDEVQLGLTREEIDAMADRVSQLLAQVDAGDVEVY